MKYMLLIPHRLGDIVLTIKADTVPDKKKIKKKIRHHTFWNNLNKMPFTILNTYRILKNKTCCDCNETKPMLNAYFQYLKGGAKIMNGYRKYCRKCEAIRVKETRPSYKNMSKARQKKILKTSKKWYKKECLNLTDRYIIQSLKMRGFTKSEITPELITIQRTQLKLKRDVKKES